MPMGVLFCVVVVVVVVVVLLFLLVAAVPKDKGWCRRGFLCITERMVMMVD